MVLCHPPNEPFCGLGFCAKVLKISDKYQLVRATDHWLLQIIRLSQFLCKGAENFMQVPGCTCCRPLLVLFARLLPVDYQGQGLCKGKYQLVRATDRWSHGR
jgi:hypothetical protein